MIGAYEALGELFQLQANIYKTEPRQKTLLYVRVMDLSREGQCIVVALKQSDGERSKRRQRRVKRSERVAAVDRFQGALSPKADVGHRNWNTFRK